MTLRRAESGRGFQTLWWTVLCVSILFSVQVLAANKYKLANNTVIAKSLGAAALKPEGVRVPVELVPEERRKSQSLAARIAKLPPGKSLYLVFKNLQTAKQLSEPLTLTIIPAEPPAEGVVPTVGQIALVEQ
jgi:hypothetical protein